MITAAQALKKAASYIGYKESPAGSNRTIFGKAYGMDRNPWCAMFVWYIFRELGAIKLYFGGNKTAYTPTLADYYKKQGRWFARPLAGDLVFFHNGKRICHVGFVEKVISSDVIQTIEGNTSAGNQSNGGQVMRRRRSIRGSRTWYVAGFGRPAYTAPKPPVKKTIAQMAQEVIDGKHGVGHVNRRKSLGITVAEYEQVRAYVNARTSTKPAKKTIAQMAQEIIEGKHGAGHVNRRKSLGITVAEYEQVRAYVNARTTTTPAKKTIDAVAREIVAGKGNWGSGATRKSRLKAAGYDASAVQRRVNQLLK